MSVRVSTADTSPMDLFGLTGKCVVVLGGGQGMGEATAHLLASLGAKVAVVDLDAERAQLVAQQVGNGALGYTIDVVDDDALVAGIAQIESEFGPIDSMAAIVGMAGWSPLVDMEMETWDRDMARNLRYFFLAAREVARGMMTRGAAGSIAVVSSVDGLRSAPYHGAYGAAKAGLVNLAKTMAEEWSPHGIRVNVVASGAVVTPRVPFTDVQTEAKMMERVPMHRRGGVDEIAKALTFFLSDMSSYVTGQTLAVDGGYLAATLFDLSGQAKQRQSTLGLDD